MASAQNMIYITANNETRTATLVDNITTKELINILTDGDIIINMNDYGGWEKVGNLPQHLSTTDSHIMAQPGDIMLYQGYQMVIFYGNNSWSYTRLGRIDHTDDLKTWLGNGNVEVIISLNNAAGIEDVTVDNDSKENVFDLTGRLVTARPLKAGIYIINGKKIAVR